MGQQKVQIKFNKSSIDVPSFYQRELPDASFKRGSNGWVNGGLCPFHDDTKAGSFRVHLSHGGFQCYACGAQGGDVIDFVTMRDRLNYKQAVSYLHDSGVCQPGKNHSVIPPEPDNKLSETSQALIQYWNNAKPADKNHPYILKKHIKPLGGIRQSGRNLLIPAYDTSGRLRAIQKIGEDGLSKPFILGSQKKNHCFLVGKDTTKPLIICEGYATAVTLFEQTGYQVAVAFDAGNLEPVAVVMRKQYPAREIIIAADNDRYHKDGTPRTDNPGLIAATRAAERISAKLAVPQFPEGDLGSDFNDLANSEVMS